ncbi:capsular polysaccharide biosynthesis protein [Neiella marina]|uniref:Capsular polysaccharide biosynthesis protein n=1 Tax=Neiella marina TaxID=508461 RepID=A0A8J2UAL2_9GAMM|nr:polysaccharide biosynthesis/export family protein [Neiella marina]GGA89856.1 capsular polysaccharide biosynthesis protein [Neiella marina]
MLLINRAANKQFGCKLASLLVLLLIQFAVYAVESDEEYLLGPGDQLNVHVYNEPDLSIETEIDRAGFVSFPFLEEVLAQGLTTRQLAITIENGLRGDYLIEPHVQVSVTRYRPFYIHGQVYAPGGYPYQPGLTVDMAIALAGGLKERASKSSWSIRRAREAHQTEHDAARDTQVMAGDIIEISESFF